jgi:tetratricopeptide (TPR) repeat protein
MSSAVWAARAAAVFGAWLVLGLGAPSLASDELTRGPAPAWVVPVTEPDRPAPAGSEGLRILLYDSQVQTDGQRNATYVRLRSTALSAQALPLLGQVAVIWSPASEEVTIHHVEIIRDGVTIDVLADQAFETLRREQNLEQAILDGRITAVLQPSGLRVGDILDFAYTTSSRDPVVGGHFEQALDFNALSAIERFRYRAAWPVDLPVRRRASQDWTPLRPRRVGGQSVLELNFEALEPIAVPADVPGRLMDVRGIELSDYADWSDIAVALRPLYDRARRIETGSSLTAEIERIRSLSEDPAVRAAAALRLVQDEVRYVALLMGPGALTPATAEETWTRRFGDCKAKTALLLALLDGLGIAADPAAVSIANGDGLSERLPRVGAFDHVLVRAVIDDRVYWMDGTRSGDRALADIAVPPFVWALPLTDADAELERLTLQPLTQPDNEVIVAIDASKGLYAPADISTSMILRGDSAAVMSTGLALLTAGQKDEGLRALWQSRFADVTITEVGSNYDDERNLMTLSMAGTTTQSWQEQGSLLPGSSVTRLSAEERVEGPFRDAPYTIIHPTFTRQYTTVRLPGGGEGFRVTGGAIDRTELGHHIFRAARLEGDTITIETTMRSLVSEITAAEAAEARAAQAARRSDPPRAFRPADYVVSEADREALAADTPTDANGWLDRALALAEAGDPEGALQATEEAVKLAPERSATWANRGIRRFWTGDREGAIADFAKAVDIDPSERIAMNGNALIAMADERHDDAVIELSRALRQVPNDNFALATRAQAYVALEDYDRALRDIDALIALHPSESTLKLRRIGLLEGLGRIEDAETEMEALAGALPDDLDVLANLASLRLRRGEFQSASDLSDRVLAADPPYPTAVLMIRAQALIALDQLDRAAADFDAIRAANPGDGGALNNICWYAGKAGVMLEQALRDCDAAHEAMTPTPNMFGSRARVLLQMGQHQAALEAYETALAGNAEFWTALFGRGLAKVALGNTADGEADKAAALIGDPKASEPFRSFEALQSPSVP